MNQVDTSITLAQAAPAGADYSSLCYQLNGLRDFSIQVTFSSATLTGSLVLQGSNDPTAFTSPGTAIWNDIEDSTQSVTAGAAHMWNVRAANYKYTRFVWDYSAGAGTLTAWLEVKYIEG